MGNTNTATKDDEVEKLDEQFRYEEQLKYGEIDQQFFKHDLDDNQCLNEFEFKEAVMDYISVHPDKEGQLKEMLEHLEMGNNSRITLEEFRSMMVLWAVDDISFDTLIDVFKCFDKNLNGAFGKQELIHVFAKLGLNLSEEEAVEMMNEVDVNSDGTIDLKEFIKIMISK
jgi:Ca2+-binding EF-hand superfamily protein